MERGFETKQPQTGSSRGKEKGLGTLFRAPLTRISKAPLLKSGRMLNDEYVSSIPYDFSELRRRHVLRGGMAFEASYG